MAKQRARVLAHGEHYGKLVVMLWKTESFMVPGWATWAVRPVHENGWDGQVWFFCAADLQRES